MGCKQQLFSPATTTCSSAAVFSLWRVEPSPVSPIHAVHTSTGDHVCCVGNSGTGSRGIGSGMECYARGSGAGLFGDETNGKRAGRWERQRRSGWIPNGAAVGETSARRYQFALLSCDLKQGQIGGSIGFVTAYLCSFFFSIPSEFCPRYSPPLRMAACPS